MWRREPEKKGASQDMEMHERLKYAQASPEATRAMSGLGKVVRESGLEPSLLELVKIRASQINGCAYCIDMHTKDARAAGETEQRIYGLSAWRESPYYTDRERSALEWTEVLTLIAQDHVPDEVYERVRPHFTEKELVDLTLAVVEINGWNRFAIGFRTPPGTYKPELTR
jgi:AhpD family alkylhydroperoxidase